MAPRREPRSSRNLPLDCPPRSRLSRLAVDTEEAFSEVPDYLVCPKAKTKKDLMRRASILKAGVTGYGCAPGYSGVIVYPLSELENELLQSMGSKQAVLVGGPSVVMGQPPQEEAAVQEGAPFVDGAPGAPIAQVDVVVEEGVAL